MKHATAAGLVLVLASPAFAPADAVQIAGTVCRASRLGGRVVLGADGGGRIRVAFAPAARVAFEGRPYEAADLRPGDRVEVFGDRADGGAVTALRADVSVPVGTALLGALLGTKPPLIGRFAVQEAKTEFFSLNLAGDDYVRVDAKAAYGPKGRVRVSSLKSGDLLEIGGTWTKKGEIRASSIRVLTDDEPDSCRRDAQRGETKDEMAAREAAERRFLDGYDDAPVEEDEPEPDER